MGASVVIMEDGVRSQILEIWDHHRFQNLIPILHCIEIAFNDDKLYFACERDTAPHHDTAPIEKCHAICAAICIAFSTSSPYFDPAIQLPQTEP